MPRKIKLFSWCGRKQFVSAKNNSSRTETEEQTSDSPTATVKTTVGHIGAVMDLILHHGEHHHSPLTSPTPAVKTSPHSRHIEDMSTMYLRLRDEAQAELDTWLEGGLKTIVSIAQSESLEKTADADFHLSMTVTYDEP